ncbi:hypothetical protein [Streptomyces sp. NPDC089799]|uniref:hypothetical protein n=1 Tax=Streptomyces sp. NPDC089799 TaxID=3155066 RepID=UPI00343E48B6
MSNGDFWDRPGCDWGEGPPQDDVTLKLRQHANSCYRLGSEALARRDLELAENWLWAAVQADHPGGWFRFAIVVYRQGPKAYGGAANADAYVRYLVEGAAGFGHGDAQTMRPLLRDPSAGLPPFPWEDPQYGPELVAALRTGLRALHPLNNDNDGKSDDPS